MQRPHPPLIVGGAAGPRSARLAARWADEYNTVYVTPEQARERRAGLDEACRREDRDPGTLRFTMMNGFLVGADRDDLHDRARRLAEWRGETDRAAADLDGWIAETTEPWLVGTPEEIVARLREYEAAGIEAVMLQHHLYGDLEALELIGREVIPEVGMAEGTARVPR